MKNKTKEDIKQICTYFSPDLAEGTCGYSLTEEQFNKLFEYIEENFVAKGEVREMLEKQRRPLDPIDELLNR